MLPKGVSFVRLTESEFMRVPWASVFIVVLFFFLSLYPVKGERKGTV